MGAGLWLCVTVRFALLIASSAVEDANSFSEATRLFSLEFFKILSKEPQANIVVSPLSLATLLSILQQGAVDNSNAQLEHVLHQSKEESKESYGRIVQSLKKRKTKSTLEFGNSIFVDTNLQIRHKFKEIVQRNFLAEVQSTNFALAEDSANEINEWVSSATRKRITQIVTADDLPPTTSMVLVNAIFFKGVWLQTFSRNQTVDGPFYPLPDAEVKVPMMRKIGHFHGGENLSLGAKWVEMPFDGEEFSMVLVLPTENHGLDALVEQMSVEDLRNMLNTRKTKLVNLKLPRFKLQCQGSVVSQIQQLGLTDVFTEKSNLSGISSTTNLVVSDIIHKADIEVNEEGSTASAATAILVNTLSLSDNNDDMVFNANHPFLAILVDKMNSIPLFMAKIFNPESSLGTDES